MAKLDYYNLTHKGLSYSRQLTLQGCPRKYELDAKFAIKANRTSVTFSYGHAVAAGIQAAIAGMSYDQCMIECMVAYHHDINDIGTSGEKASKKSIWQALIATDTFCKRYAAGVYGYLDGWEIARVLSPKTNAMVDAVELTFVVDLVDGFSYEGHIDLVLWHPEKKRFMVVELKTTGMSKVDEASYKNSAQALGYGAVIDLMASDMGQSASFDVLYLVFQSRNHNLVPMPFVKTAKDRADWITSLIIDMQQIQQYEELGYPKRGQRCFDFYRPCEYISTCRLSDDAISKMFAQADGTTEEEQFTKMSSPDFTFTLDQLLERQEELLLEIQSGKEDIAGDADLFMTSMLDTDI